MFNFSDLFKLFDSQVNLTSVLLVGIAAFFGWTLVRKAGSLVVGAGRALCAAFPGAFTLAGTLFVLGGSAVGYGIGELNSGDKTPNYSEFSNQDLLRMMNSDAKEDRLKIVLAHARARQDLSGRSQNVFFTSDVPSAQKEQAPKNSLRLGLFSLCAGIASMVVGVSIWGYKVS